MLRGSFMDNIMNKEDIKKLKEEKKAIEARLVSLSNKEGDESSEESAWFEYGQKSDENAAEVSEYADKVSLKEQLEKRLESISYALDAIEKKTYGTCRVCGKEIGEARLKAMPTATRCLTCKQQT